MAQVQDIVCTNPELSEKLEFMWNNQEFSDTLFLVNDVQFHASSHLVSVTSNVLKTMLDTHFKHCGDREIRIGSIKHDESFSVILKYIYGMGINFSQMDRAVLCEVVCQSERFELARFAKELKSYMSKLECFELNSAVILLNTAKKFELKDLYEKLAIFAFENAAQFVKHESFVNLQYDVVLDLLKADCLFTREIDILLAALNWHRDNINESSCSDEEISNKEDENTDVAEASVSCNGEGISNKEDDSTDVDEASVSCNGEGISNKEDDSTDVDEASVSCNGEGISNKEDDNTDVDEASVSCNGEGISNKEDDNTDVSEASGSNETPRETHDINMDVALNVNAQSADEASGKTENLDSETVALEDISTVGSSNLNKSNTGTAVASPNQEVVKEFSEKVLKTLLSHVRIKQISAVDFMSALQMDLVKKHKEVLIGCCSLVSQSCEPRRKYAPPPSINSQIENEDVETVVPAVEKSEPSYALICRNICCENLHRITRQFTVKYRYVADSEVCTIGGLEWNVHMKHCSTETEMYLACRCTGDKDIEWQCATECQVRMISNNPKYPTRVLPEFTNSFAHFLNVNFHNNCTQVLIGKYDDTKRPKDWQTGYLKNRFFTIEVHFQYIHKTVMETKQII